MTVSILASLRNMKLVSFLLLILFVVVTLRVIVILISTNSPVSIIVSNDNQLHKTSKVSRLSAYCYGHSRSTSSSDSDSIIIPAKDEGTLNNTSISRSVTDDMYVLKHLVVVIRHGDRSNIHAMPGSAEHQTIPPAASTTTYLDSRVHIYLPYSEYFKLSYICAANLTATHDQVRHKEIGEAMSNPLKLFAKADGNQQQGLLTTVGFMQLLEIGVELHKAYHDFITAYVRSPSSVDVRSTNYERTIQSAVAFMTTFLSNVRSKATPFTIKLHQYEDDECMHGVGVRQSSHGVSSNHKSESISLGECSKASILGIKQREALRSSLLDDNSTGSSAIRDTYKSLESIFDVSMRDRTITELVDASIPQYCHGIKLPCSMTNESKCLSDGLLGDMMEHADSRFCDVYTGNDGGRISTNLATYPFLSEITHALVSSIADSSSGSDDSSSSNSKLHIFAGHDTVISPVLASLTGSNNRWCGWPPYASRIVFERWESKSDSSTGSTSVNSSTNSYIRVVYNGDDITRYIPSCRGNDMCLIGDFKQQVLSLLGSHSTFSYACKV